MPLVLLVLLVHGTIVAPSALTTSAFTCVSTSFTSFFWLGQVYISMDGSLKLGCLAQAMMVSPKGDVASSADVGGMDDELEGEVDMEVEVNNIFCSNTKPCWCCWCWSCRCRRCLWWWSWGWWC